MGQKSLQPEGKKMVCRPPAQAQMQTSLMTPLSGIQSLPIDPLMAGVKAQVVSNQLNLSERRLSFEQQMAQTPPKKSQSKTKEKENVVQIAAKESKKQKDVQKKKGSSNAQKITFFQPLAAAASFSNIAAQPAPAR